MDPNTMAAVMAALGGLFGGGGSSDYLKDLMRFQMKQARGIGQQAKWFEGYAKGVPGSDPQEQAQANTMMGMLGSSGRQGYEQMIAQGYNAQNAGNVGDMLGNYGMAQSAQRAAALGGLQQNWLGARQGARTTAAGLRASAAGVAQGAGGVAGMMPQQGADIGGLLAGIAQQWSYGQQQKGYNANFQKFLDALMQSGMGGQQANLPTASGNPLADPYGAGGSGNPLADPYRR